MNEKVMRTCELMLENRRVLKKQMFWEIGSNNYAIMAGMITASKNIHADADRYKECKKILHKNVSFLSEIRGIVQAVVVTKMMMADDPEAYIQGVSAVYKRLRSIHKLTASHNMVMAAMNIYEHAGLAGMEEDIEKLEALYKDLKKQHPFLISDDDRAYLSMIIGSGMNVDAVVERIEDSYESCKSLAFDKNAVHSLAQILAFSPMHPEAQKEYVLSMISELKHNGRKFSKTHGLSAAGALALLDVPQEQLVNDIVEVDNYLKKQKGFKWYSLYGRIRVIYAMLVVLIAYSSEDTKLGEAISGNITMAITEAIISMIVVSSIVAAHNSSSSSST